MKTWILAVTLALGLSLAAAGAFAAPVTWYVTGTLDGGGAISGSFAYDADTNTYSAINITTTAGSLPGATYTATNGSFSNANLLVAVTMAGAIDGQPVITLPFQTALNGTGGTRTFSGSEGLCSTGCLGFLPGSSHSVSGSASTTPPVAPAAIPTMSEWAMILLGVLLAGGAALMIQRRRQAA